MHLCSRLEKCCLYITAGVYRAVSQHGPVKPLYNKHGEEGYGQCTEEAGFEANRSNKPCALRNAVLAGEKKTHTGVVVL